MSRIVHFEIHAADLARARAFYTGLFGWQFTSWGGGAMEYWLITTGPDNTPGINGGLVKRMGDAPSEGQAVNAFPCTIGTTETVDAVVTKATSLGGTVAVPKMAIPSMGWLAYLKDTEGNIFGVMQEDPSAK